MHHRRYLSNQARISSSSSWTSTMYSLHGPLRRRVPRYCIYISLVVRLINKGINNVSSHWRGIPPCPVTVCSPTMKSLGEDPGSTMKQNRCQTLSLYFIIVTSNLTFSFLHLYYYYLPSRPRIFCPENTWTWRSKHILSWLRHWYRKWGVRMGMQVFKAQWYLVPRVHPKFSLLHQPDDPCYKESFFRKAWSPISSHHIVYHRSLCYFGCFFSHIPSSWNLQARLYQDRGNITFNNDQQQRWHWHLSVWHLSFFHPFFPRESPSACLPAHLTCPFPSLPFHFSSMSPFAHMHEPAPIPHPASRLLVYLNLSLLIQDHTSRSRTLLLAFPCATEICPFMLWWVLTFMTHNSWQNHQLHIFLPHPAILHKNERVPNADMRSESPSRSPSCLPSAFVPWYETSRTRLLMAEETRPILNHNKTTEKWCPIRKANIKGFMKRYLFHVSLLEAPWLKTLV